MTATHHLLVCEHYEAEVRAALAAEELAEVTVTPFPAHCGCPRGAPGGRPRDLVEGLAVSGPVDVLAAACWRDLEARPREGGRHAVRVHRAEQCLHLLAPAAEVNRRQRGGAYLLTAGWLGRWPEARALWGFDAATLRDFFQESATRLVLLDTGVASAPAARLAALADETGLPAERWPVGLDHLRLRLARIVLERRLADERAGTLDLLAATSRRAADYAMAFDLVGRLTGIMSEREVIAQVLDVFVMLFAPGRACYVPIAGGRRRPPEVWPPGGSIAPEEIERLVGLAAVAFADTPTGFALPIEHQGERLGVVAIEGIAREQEGRDLNVTLTIAGVCGLAIANARAYERVRRDEARQRFLGEAGTILTSSLEADSTLARVARLAIPTLADACWIDLASDDGVVRRLALAVLDDLPAPLRARLDALVPAPGEGPEARTLGEGRPVVEDDTLILPLHGHGRIAGALGLVCAAARPETEHAPSALTLAQELARRCALVLENVRLYHEAREAVLGLEGFLSMASHELKTPLTALQLGVEATLRRLEKEPTALSPEWLVARVRASARQIVRLDKLVNNLLDVSRITAGRLQLDREVVDLVAVVEEVVARHAEDGARLGCEVSVAAPASLIGQWDRLRVDQIVTNLLSNAVKYGAGRPVEIAIEARGDVAALLVRDHGVGIPIEDQGRIFERFERLASRQAVGGFGLGLWIVRQIVDALGGRVTVESRPGEGARFVVELPRGG